MPSKVSATLLQVTLIKGVKKVHSAVHHIILNRHVKLLEKKMRDNALNDLFFTSNFARTRFVKICLKQDWNLFKIMFRILNV